jgi:hypothetical protein
MAQQNKTQLQSSINSQINDNIAGDITAADIRDNLINMTDSLLFNSGSQSITGSLSVSGASSFASTTTFAGSTGREVIIGSVTTSDYFLLSAGQLFIRTNNSNVSSNTGLVLQSGNSNNYDAQIFINGNDINSTSVIQFKTSNNGALTTRAQINNTGMAVSLPVSITGSLSMKGDNVSSNITVVSASYTSGNSDEAVSIRTSSSINIPSFLLGTNGTKTLVVSSYNGNDASIYATDLTSLSLDCNNGNVNLQPNTLGNTVSHGNFLVVSGSSLIVTGSLAVTGSAVSLKGLPTSEPAISGQLWLSGSAGSNSKVLCVRN